MIELAEGLSLPDNFVTQTCAILARRGAGKTYAALKLAEQMSENGLPFVLIDPTGVCWGLRSSASGEDSGLPIVILGGEHGDLPLEPTSGRVVAEFVVSSGTSLILDLSLFDSRAAQDRFVYEFADRLYRVKAKHREPLHLLVDEADQFAPQRPMPDQTKMLGAWESIVRLGRSRGLGVTMITQRPAVLNKNVLTQIELLIVMQITSPQDRAAIKAWIDGNADAGESKTVLDSLASFKQGDAWVWSPAWLGILQRVRIGVRSTFDSSRTPDAKGAVLAPKRVADVDLGALSESMAATIERTEANDPKRLKRRITELERELAQALAANPEPEVIVKEVPFIPPSMMDVAAAAARLAEDLSVQSECWAAAAATGRKLAESAALAVKMDEGPWMAEVRAKKPAHVVRVQPVAPVRLPRAGSEPSGDLSKIERAILSALVNYPQGRTQRQVCMLSGYKNSGHMKNALSSLRTKGFVDRGQPIHITPEGVDALGDFDPLPTGPALRDFWLNQLDKAPRSILEVLLPLWPDGMSNEDLASAAGYTFNGHVKNQLSKLRTLELIERGQPVRVHPDFMEAIS